MALYDVWINGVPLNDKVDGDYAVDVFSGRRAVAPHRSIAEVGQGPGVKLIPGTPDTYPMQIEVWVDGRDDPERLERHLDRLLGALQHDGTPLVVEWERGGKRVSARCELLQAMPDIVHTTCFARIKIALENLDGAWRGAEQTRSLNSGTALPWGVFDSNATIWDARFTIHGPATNPQIIAGDRRVTYRGVVPAGKKLELNSHPVAARLDGKPVVRNLTQVGSGPRLLDLYPGEQVRFTASGVNADTHATVTWRPAKS